MGTRLGVSATPRTFAVSIAAAACVSAGSSSVSFASDAVEEAAVLSSTASASVSFAGEATAGSSLDSLGRSIPALLGGSVNDSTLASSAAADADFKTLNQATALSPSATPFGYRVTRAKTVIVVRDWQVNETLGVDLDIEDFDERTFALVDSLGISLDSTAGFRSSALASAGSAATSFSAISTKAATFSSTGVGAVSLGGAGLIVNTGDLSSDGVAAVAFQGTAAGTVFGTGALVSSGSGAASYVGRSFHEATQAVSGAASVSFASETIFSADFAIAGSASVDFSFSSNAALSSAGSGAASFASEVIFGGRLSSAGVGAVQFVGNRIGGTPVFTLDVAAEDLEIDVEEGAIFAVIFEPSEIVVP